MTVTGPEGGQIAPDWSCYQDGAAFLYRPFDVDASDTGDASSEDGAAEDAQIDAPTSVADASPPPADSSAPDAAPQPDASASDYSLHLTDFVSNAPPVGATVNVIWGPTSVGATTAFTGTVNDAGLLFFPPPPSGTELLTYHVTGPGQAPLYWLSAVIVPPPGATAGNSISVNSETELLVSVLAGQSAASNLAILVTGAEDCQYRDVAGAQIQMIDTTTKQPVATGTTQGAPRTFYLQDNFPQTSCTYSSNVGRAVWAMVNAPVDTSQRYVLQLSGRMSASQTAPVLLDQVPVETYAGTTTVQRAFRLNASPPN
jgi:hypothetical protein